MATECQVREEVGERVVEEWNIREFGGIEWVNERKGILSVQRNIYLNPYLPQCNYVIKVMYQAVGAGPKDFPFPACPLR